MMDLAELPVQRKSTLKYCLPFKRWSPVLAVVARPDNLTDRGLEDMNHLLVSSSRLPVSA
jgi:hypothetical protein